ncbi:MAG: four helix bundle protein, partial [Thermodesulfovibrionales bacterium]|nr:four helix bundle protein [Thermodesulfovibrionales bacterium]
MAKNLYRDLVVWQKSVELIKKVYSLAENLPKSEEYNLKQQLKRAVVSVSLNIAEGKNRRTAKDF